jgi:dihydroorotate dehydrogenase (NAD+) catalytic subunit
MAVLKTNVGDLEFKNPVLTAAGPNSRNGDVLLEAARGGAGGLVAKTVSMKAAEVPKPNIASIQRGARGVKQGLLNAELWSEKPLEEWLRVEYSRALESGLPLIASIGYTPEEVAKIAPQVEDAGVHGIEFSTHYVGGHEKIAKTLNEAVDIPIFAKLSPKVDVAEVAKSVEPYVDGIVAINTYGPCLRIDIETGRPLLGSDNGYGWMSGAALKPIALRCVADIAQAVDIPVIGVGGVTSGEDAIEYFMAGASAVEVCSAAILDGPQIYGKIAEQIDEWLDAHNHDSVSDIHGIALQEIERVTPQQPPVVDIETCTFCRLCERSCVYDAISVSRDNRDVRISPEKCQQCGMCISVCPVRALSFE